jgi:acetyl esterase/lipase
MKHTAALVVLVSVAVLAMAALMAQPPDEQQTRRPRQLTLPDNVEMRTGVVYGTGGGRELKLDLFLPKHGDGLRPAVIFVHGGGWRNGGPSQFHRQSAYLAGVGYVCASIEYRLSGEAQFPAALEDTKCAVRWLRANARELRVDTDRVALSGGSAGGHLAAMVATTGPGLFEGEGGHADQSSAADLAVCFNPVVDLAAMGKVRPDHPMLVAFLGKTFEEDPELYARASPITYVDENDPPMLVLHGTKDTTVPYDQAQAFIRKLADAGVEAELFSAEDASHAFFNNEPWYTPTVKAMEAFLNKHFRPEEDQPAE